LFSKIKVKYEIYDGNLDQKSLIYNAAAKRFTLRLFVKKEGNDFDMVVRNLKTYEKPELVHAVYEAAIKKDLENF